MSVSALRALLAPTFVARVPAWFIVAQSKS